MRTSVRRTSVTWPQAGKRDERGFSLVETIFALGIMAFGLLTLATAFTYGLTHLGTGNALLIAKQKAAEAVESVFMSRDTRTVSWGLVRNKADGGIFLGGPQPMKVAGADGMVNTDDDGAIEVMILPGPDGLIGTADDETTQLDQFTREIEIIDVGANLREIRVTIRYPFRTVYRDFVLMTYISSFA